MTRTRGEDSVRLADCAPSGLAVAVRALEAEGIRVADDFWARLAEPGGVTALAHAAGIPREVVVELIGRLGAYECQVGHRRFLRGHLLDWLVGGMLLLGGGLSTLDMVDLRPTRLAAFSVRPTLLASRPLATGEVIDETNTRIGWSRFAETCLGSVPRQVTKASQAIAAGRAICRDEIVELQSPPKPSSGDRR